MYKLIEVSLSFLDVLIGHMKGTLPILVIPFNGQRL